MSIIDTTAHTPKDRHKESRPERITVGGTTFVRNDVVAKQQGDVAERTLDRGDQHGAPYAFFGGVKYRPEPQYSDWVLATSIKQRKPEPPPRTLRRGPYRTTTK
jgi:hypothetical protein